MSGAKVATTLAFFSFYQMDCSLESSEEVSVDSDFASTTRKKLVGILNDIITVSWDRPLESNWLILTSR